MISTLLASALLAAVGVVAGIVNTMAGGGSLLTLPALIAVGLPAPVANGTNRISVLLQSIVGSWAMYRRIPFPTRRTALLALPTIVGAVFGAWTASSLDRRAMELVIGGALVVGAIILLARPARFLDVQEGEADTHRWQTSLTLLAVGFYGGLVQAGVGALIILALVGVGRWQPLQATGAKNAIIAAYSVPALVIFAINDQVALLPGLALAVGAMIGAELGARLTVRGGNKLILAAVAIAVFLAAGKLVLLP